MRWERAHRYTPAGVALADRHYSRRTPGSPQFVPPGRNVVLVTPCGRAVWASTAPMFATHAWPGAWVCSIFRNEGAGLSSELIREAVAATRWRWSEVPEHGMITFVDPAKVRRKRDPGRCFLRAGFQRVGATQGGHGRNPLVVLQLLEDGMPAPEPAMGESLRLFA
jgi:hypothetical protein